MFDLEGNGHGPELGLVQPSSVRNGPTYDAVLLHNLVNRMALEQALEEVFWDRLRS